MSRPNQFQSTSVLDRDVLRRLMSSAGEAPAFLPSADAGEGPEGNNGGRAAAPNPTPKAPAQKQAPLAMAPPKRRSGRGESSVKPSPKAEDVRPAADAADDAQLEEAEPSESAPAAARDEGAAAKPPTDGAKGVPVKMGQAPPGLPGDEHSKEEKREKRVRSKPKPKPGMPWSEALGRRRDREKAAAVQREAEAAEIDKLQSAQEADRQRRAALRAKRKRSQLYREGSEDAEILIEEIANELAADSSASDAKSAAEAVDGGGGDKPSSDGEGAGKSAPKADSAEEAMNNDSAEEAMNNESAEKANDNNSAADDSDSDEKKEGQANGGNGSSGESSTSTSSQSSSDEDSLEGSGSENQQRAQPKPLPKPKKVRAAAEKPKLRSAGGGSGGGGDGSESDNSSSTSSGSDSSADAEAKRLEDDVAQRESEPRRSPRKGARPVYKDDIEDDRADAQALEHAEQLSLQTQEFEAKQRALVAEVEKLQRRRARAKKLEASLRQQLSAERKARPYQHADANDSDSDSDSVSADRQEGLNRPVPKVRGVPPADQPRSRDLTDALKLEIYETRDTHCLRQGIDSAEYRELHTLWKLGKPDGRDCLQWTTRVPTTIFDQAQGLSMMLCDPRSNMPSLSHLMKDFKELSDDRLRSLKGETFEIQYRAFIGQYGPAVQPFVSQLLNGDLARTGLLRAMSTSTDARDFDLFDMNLAPSWIAVELETDYGDVDIDLSQMSQRQRFDNMTSDSKRYIARLREVTTFLMTRICTNILQVMMKMGVSAMTVSRQKAVAVQRVVAEINRAHPDGVAGQVEYATFDGALDCLGPEIVEVLLTLTTLCHQGVDLKRDRFQALNVQMNELLTFNWCGLPPHELMGLIDLLAEYLDAYERLEGAHKFMEHMANLNDHIEKDAIDEGNLSVTMQSIYHVLRPATGFDPTPTEVFQGVQKLAARNRRLRMKSDDPTPTRRTNASPHMVAMIRARSGQAGGQKGAFHTRTPQRQNASSRPQPSRARQPTSRSQGYQDTSRQPRSAPMSQTPRPSAVPFGGDGRTTRASSKDYSQRCKFPRDCMRVGRKYEDSGRDMCQYQHDSATSKGTLKQLKDFNLAQPLMRGQSKQSTQLRHYTEANSGPSRRRAPSGAPRHTQRNHIGAVDAAPPVDADL